MGAPLDEECSAKTMVTYVYKSTQPPAPAGRGGQAPGALPSGFKPFDPSAPRPADLAQTTTGVGKTVDYIVRRERGTINRAIYEIAFLHVPGQPFPIPGMELRAGTAGWCIPLVADVPPDITRAESAAHKRRPTRRRLRDSRCHP